MFKKLTAGFLALSIFLCLTACGDGNYNSPNFKSAMVTDVGGINDQSFNQAAWAGMQKLRDNNEVQIAYIESKQESEYATNLEVMADQNNDLIWGIGYAMGEAIISAAQKSDDINFAIIDNSYENTPENVTGVRFKTQEPAFLVGYIAALTTKTNKLGFVGGQAGVVIDQFEYGYRAGINYAEKELGKTITLISQYADSFTDSAKGKAIANKMYSDGCDVIFHAAGAVGSGVIESAKDNNKYVIGVDCDQSYMAPDNVLTSALKNVDIAIEQVTLKLKNGENIGGHTFIFGLNENGVGIPENYELMGKETYDKAIKVKEKIQNAEIVPPQNKQEYSNFKA